MSDLQNTNLQQMANSAARTNEIKSENLTPNQNFDPAKDTAPAVETPVIEEPKIFMATPPVQPLEPQVINSNTQMKLTQEEFEASNFNRGDAPSNGSSVLPDNDSNDIEAKKMALIRELVQNGIPVDEAKSKAEEKFAPKEETIEDSNEDAEDNASENNIYEIRGTSDQIDKIVLPEEVKNKTLTAKVIKLTEVVDEDLKNIKVHKYNRVDKLSALRHLTNAISRYSVPLPALGEYATFRGAQTIDLVTNLTNDDDSPVETVEKTAAMLYDKFISGTITDKYNENGDVVMGINEFMNIYRYNDMYYGLFGIFCASVKEEIESELGCPNCKKSFKVKYNIQDLLELDSVSEDYKNKISTIIENKSDSRIITSLVNKSKETTRYKSPESGIIIDMCQPSIAKAVRVLSQLDPNDKMQAYNSIALLYVDTIYIPDPSTGEWVIYGIDEEVEKDIVNHPENYPDYEPITELFTIIQELTQTDRNLIGDIIQKKYIFGVNFVLHSKCPHCGRELTNNLDIKQMVFQVARGLSGSTEL